MFTPLRFCVYMYVATLPTQICPLTLFPNILNLQYLEIWQSMFIPLCLQTFELGRKEPLRSGSYMSAHVLLNLLNGWWGGVKKCDACRAFYHFFTKSLINSIKQEHEC